MVEWAVYSVPVKSRAEWLVGVGQGEPPVQWVKGRLEELAVNSTTRLSTLLITLETWLHARAGACFSFCFLVDMPGVTGSCLLGKC